MNFDKIILTRKELFSLRHLCSSGSLKKDQVYHFDYLYDLGFVDLLESETETDSFGIPLVSDVCVVTDQYRRYSIFCRRSLLHRYLTPVSVSIATTIVLYMSQHWLLPVLQSLLSHLPGFHP